MSDNKIIPALRFNFLTKYYDSLVALTTNESFLRGLMLSKIKMNKSDTLLDIACGTGTFLSLVSSEYKDAKFSGIDADEKILQKAIKKNKNDIIFVNAYSNSLPFNDDTFDFVCTSLFFHHINDDLKKATLSEINRVLKPTGRFLFCDWDKPQNFFENIGFFLVRMLDGFNTTRANQTGEIGKILEKQFPGITKTDSFQAPLGRISIWTTNK